jgi:hypothetical protein
MGTGLELDCELRRIPMYPNVRRLTCAAIFASSLCIVASAAGCSADSHQVSADLPSSVTATPARAPWRLPDRNGGFDYQLGGAYAAPPGVTIVERDRMSSPSGAGYDICYVNGFQTQPADSETFAKQHPELIVLAGSKPLADPEWPDEYIFDTSTEAKRAALASIVKPWIEGCKSAGYSAVEIDNLDSYTRARDSLDAEDNIALATEYARIAHGVGLTIAQKNTAEEASRLRTAGYDFAIAESCFEFSECADYTEQYPVVLDVEYTDELGPDAFALACNSSGRPPIMIMRDHNLVGPGDAEYFYQRCGS